MVKTEAQKFTTQLNKTFKVFQTKLKLLNKNILEHRNNIIAEVVERKEINAPLAFAHKDTIIESIISNGDKVLSEIETQLSSLVNQDISAVLFEEENFSKSFSEENQIKIFRWLKRKKIERKKNFAIMCENVEKTKLKLSQEIEIEFNPKDELIRKLIKTNKSLKEDLVSKGSSYDEQADLEDLIISVESNQKEQKLIQSFESLTEIWRKRTDKLVVKFLGLAELAFYDQKMYKNRARKALLVGDILMKHGEKIQNLLKECESMKANIEKIDHKFLEIQKMTFNRGDSRKKEFGIVGSIENFFRDLTKQKGKII